MERERLSEPNSARRRVRNRNIALALILASFVILFYVVTLVKGIPLLNRPM